MSSATGDASFAYDHNFTMYIGQACRYMMHCDTYYFSLTSQMISCVSCKFPLTRRRTFANKSCLTWPKNKESKSRSISSKIVPSGNVKSVIEFVIARFSLLYPKIFMVFILLT